MRHHRRSRGGIWRTPVNTQLLVIVCLLPSFSIQELSLPHLSAAAAAGSPGSLARSAGQETFLEAPAFPEESHNANETTLGRLTFPQDSSSGNTNNNNASLRALAEDIGRLEGNLASLIQSFLALQRSVFNLEQLQELLVLLLEDILKQTGNVDRGGKGVVQTTSGSGSRSGSSAYGHSDKTIDDDGVDSADIDETGEDTGDDDDNDDNEDTANDNRNNRNTRDGRTGGGGGGHTRGGASNNNNGQGGDTNPFGSVSGVARGQQLNEANSRRFRHDGPNHAISENQHQQQQRQQQQQGRRRFVNRASHDSDGSSEEFRAAASGSEEEGGMSRGTIINSGGDGGGGPNSILSKGTSSSNVNKIPSSSAATSPGKPQLSEPMASSSFTSQLEARLNDMIQRLNPSNIFTEQLGASSHSQQQLSHIHAAPPSREHQRRLLLGESPYADHHWRPIFEPLEILAATRGAGGAKGTDSVPAAADGDSSPTEVKIAVGGLQGQKVKLKQRIDVVSHGGPLVGPEDFTSPFMERLEGNDGPGERSTGMISNMMQKEQAPLTDLETSILETAHKTQGNTKATTSASNDGYIPTSTTPPPASTQTSEDFDQIIATLLKDLGDHLRRQRSQHEESSITSNVLDQAVMEISKLTWVQKPPRNDSSTNPGYSVHIAAVHDSSSHKEGSDSSLIDDDQHTTVESRIESKSVSKENGPTGDPHGAVVAASQILSTIVPPINHEDSSIHTMNIDENDRIWSTTQPLDTTTSMQGRNDRTESLDENEGNQSVLTMSGLWDWLRYFRGNDADANASLRTLIKLLSELSSERHNMSKELTQFGQKGQKLMDNEMQLLYSTTGLNIETDGTNANNDSEQTASDILKDLDSKDTGTDGDSESQDAEGSEDEELENDEDLEYIGKTLEGKQPSDHPNSVFRSDNYEHEESNSVGGYNKTDSSSSEEHEDDDTSTEASRSESEEEEDDDDDDDYDDDDEFDQGSYPTGNPAHDKREQNNNSPLKVVLPKHTDDASVKHYEQTLQDSINEVTNAQSAGKVSDKNPGFDTDYTMENMDSLHEDDDDDSSEREEETFSSESNSLDYYDVRRVGQETQLYSPPMQYEQSGKIPHFDVPSMSVFGNHVIMKRNTQQSKTPGTLTHQDNRRFQHSKLSRKKRQVDTFWNQLLGYGLNPMGQQQGFSHGNQGLPNHASGIQVQGNPQSQSLLQGQEPLFGFGQQHSQTGFHQTPFQAPNQPNQAGPSQGQGGPLQYPVPPFRGYPHYSRYSNYLGGLNYPHFGYPGYPAGYPGMNHEPGESPSYEGGPSADMMEEVLNSLFQRYWENVRNMLAVNGPSTTPENEYEGPITTTSTTTKTKTTTTPAPPPPPPPTTTRAATTTPKATTTKQVTTKAQPLNKTVATTTMPSVEVTNTTMNVTGAVNNTDSQIPDARNAVGQADLSLSTSLNSMAQIFHRGQIAGKNTALPPNFFHRKPLTKTSPFPFF